MRLAATGTIALLLASVAVRGQTTQAAKLSAQAVVLKTETITRSLGSSVCPIGMQARHAFFAQRQLAGNQHTPQGKSTNRAAMALQLTLTPQDKRHITSAWVTITGLSGKDVRLMPARNSYNAETLRKSMQIAFVPGDNGNVDAYFNAAGFGSIGSVQLNSVTYTDGSTWKLPAQDVCSVAPDGLMLVASN